MRASSSRFPLASAVREATHLPGRRSRRPGDPDLAAARRDAGAVRRDDGNPRRRPRRSGGGDPVTMIASEADAQRATAEYDVRLIGLTKRFDDVVAVDGISLEIDRGQFFALLGPSGCGKTTTLRMIGGFEEPTEG